MAKVKRHITVFEHEVLRVGKGENDLSDDQFLALERYHGNGVRYFKLVYNGVQFNEHVGVIQVGDTLIEILPKADRNDKDAAKWRYLLIGMLRSVGSFNIKNTSSSNLKIKPNTVLDLYFELFIKEVEFLVHTGLIKKYRKKEGNVTALKGNLQFGKHIHYNLIHQERFYVRHTTYDVDHNLHFILYKALKLLKLTNTNDGLKSRIGSLLLHFPEMPDIKITENTFDKLVYNRKNQHYKKALEIAKLILLQYHPDVAKGKNHVLALMFDMNLLWEQFIYITLRKIRSTELKITAQTSKFFWKPYQGRRSRIIPDILIQNDGENIILDTKWKNLGNNNPSPDDLRQMYVYHDYYDAKKVALVYPGPASSCKGGFYLDQKMNSKLSDKQCSVIIIPAGEDIKAWQDNIQSILLGFAI